MTSWLKGPLGTGIGRKGIRSSSQIQDVDPAAAFNSFIHHWQQTKAIINNSSNRHVVSYDDTKLVLNHTSQMVALLLADLKNISISCSHTEELSLHDMQEPTPIFDHFLGEEILGSIFRWSLTAGDYCHLLKLEQLKIYEQLLSHSHSRVLVYQPIWRPLLKLLESCGGYMPPEVEKRLVILLNQLCVSLSQNHQYMDFFFLCGENQSQAIYLIFSLLLQFVHNEGAIGQQARDSLLLCMSLSTIYDEVGQYIVQHSNFCTVLAAGLSGLYSMLPRVLPIEGEGWHRICHEDVAEIENMQIFLNSLEFCNAVIQGSHVSVQEQLVDLLYQGFLLPVLGPALLQSDPSGDYSLHRSPIHATVLNEVTTTTAYVELFLRTVTERELQKVFLTSLVTPNSETGSSVLTELVARLHSPNSQLCSVTLSLFTTLVEFQSEEVMLSLVFQYLSPSVSVGLHWCPESLAKESIRFLQLIPSALQPVVTKKKSGRTLSEPETKLQFLSETMRGDTSDVDCSNSFSAYLRAARLRADAVAHGCSLWAWRYDGTHPSPAEAADMLVGSSSCLDPKIRGSSYLKSGSCSYPVSNGGLYLKSGSCSYPESGSRSYPESGGSSECPEMLLSKPSCDKGEETLDSLGGRSSSGYESVGDMSSPKQQQGSAEPSIFCSEEDAQFWKELELLAVVAEKEIKEIDLEELDNMCSSYCLIVDKITNYGQTEVATSNSSLSLEDLSCFEIPREESENVTPLGKPMLGPFMEALFLRVDQMLSSDIHVNLLVTSLISLLACYPQHLMILLLLDTSAVFCSGARSLYEVLSSLKKRIDAVLTADDLLISEAETSFTQRLIPECPAPSPVLELQSGSISDRSQPRSIIEKITRIISGKVNGPSGKMYDHLPLTVQHPTSYRFVRHSTSSPFGSHHDCDPTERQRHAARCAVLLREWMKELCALAMEHSVRVDEVPFSFPS